MAYQPGSFTGAAQLPQESNVFENLAQSLMQSIQGGMQLRQLPEQQRIVNALRQAQAQEAQAQAGLAGAKTQQQQMLADYMQGQKSGDQGGAGFNAPGAIGLKDAYMRRLAGLPEETPQEKMARELETSRLKAEQAKKLEQQEGTTGFLTQKQQSAQAAATGIETLEDLIKHGSSTAYLGGLLSPGHKAKYDDLITQAADSYLVAKNWPNTKESQNKAINLFTRQTGEWEADYIKRLQQKLNELKKLSGQNNEQRNYSPEDISFTAKKYGLTEEEVRRRLNA